MADALMKGNESDDDIEGTRSVTQEVDYQNKKKASQQIKQANFK